MPTEGYQGEHRYVPIYWYDDIQALDTLEYGGYTFVYNYRRYAYSTREVAEAQIDALIEADLAKKQAEKETSTEETTQAIESTVEVTEFTAPALPWYASWLEPVLNYIGNLTGAVVNYFAPLFAPLNQVAGYLGDLPKNMIDGFITGVGDMYKGVRDEGAAVGTQTFTDVVQGSPEWQKNAEAQVTALVQPIIQGYLDALDVESYAGDVETGDDAVKALENFRGAVVAGGLAAFLANALVETGSLGQIEAIKELEPLVVGKLGVDEIGKAATLIPFQTGIFKLAEYYYNEKHPVEIPTYSDLINMVVKEVMPLDEFKAWMRKQGFTEDWGQKIWDAHFRAPSWGELLQAYYKGAISRAQLEELKVLVDLDIRYNDVWDALIEMIPPYSELVNLRVKEVIDEDVFRQYLQGLGYNEFWADLIWQGHFIPPSLGDILTAWRRGLISEDRVDELMLIVDLDPRFKQVFDTRKYNDPTIREGRYMFELGAITEPQVREIVERSGLDPSYVDPMVEYLIKFQERSERTGYLNALETAFTNGTITEADLRGAVSEAGYSDEVADWKVKTAEVRRTYSKRSTGAEAEKILSVTDLKRLFQYDKISDDDFRTRLLVMGYDSGDVDLLVTLETEKKTQSESGGKKDALTQSELLNAWRYGEVTEDYVRTELMLRGLPQGDIDILLSTKKTQWGLSE